MHNEAYLMKNIEMQIRRLNANAPVPKSEGDIGILIEDWLEEFKFVAPETLVQAVKEHKAASPFFPTIADIKEKIRAVRSRQSNDTKALPEPKMTKTQKQMNLENLRKIRKRLTKPMGRARG